MQRAKTLVPVTTLLLLGATTLGGAATAATPAPPAATGSVVTMNGHGWGHGRGLGQYGALGYAINKGWSFQQIVGHYYSNTSMSNIGNPVINVELRSLTGKPLLVAGGGLTINGKPVNANAVRIQRVAKNTFQVWTGAGCRVSWTKRGTISGGAVVRATANSANPANHLQVCDPSLTYRRGYRGDLVVAETGSGQATVNRVRMESYLRGVVPRESPAGWGDVAGGKGMQALASQAVAARSYALAEHRSAWADTCDTTTCQVYGGEYVRGSVLTMLERSATNVAIAKSAGLVRKMSNGSVARTEFSSSTGGYTAGGTFPAVVDQGDAVSANPNQNWTAKFTWGQLEQAFGQGRLQYVGVSQRNGLGADGGRAVQIRVTNTAGKTVYFTGNQVRLKLGLKSDWFSISKPALK